MANYCVNTNAQPNGDHEVHNLDANCSYLPDPGNRKNLGEHSTCHTAVAQAKVTYPKADGCGHCAKECHTS